MATNSSATGTTSALFEAAWQIARLPDIDATALTLLEGALLLLHGRSGLVSIHSTQPLVENRLAGERIEAIFLTLTGAGILTRQHRDRRGATYDQYQIDSDRLLQVLRDAALLKQAYDRFQEELTTTSQAQLIATLPDNLPLSPDVKRHIPSLAATLHRLITTASQEIIILNPFFEQEGFNRLASALLAAAGRGVDVIIITRQLSDVTTVNYRVMKQLWEQSQEQGLSGQFRFYEYQQIEEGRIILASHAKVMLIDGQNAYIGSANLTEYGMSRFVEVGVILHEPRVSQLQLLLIALINSFDTKVIMTFQ
jgi:phosphatidylserine/phosphatidylglycerophosphate/cardiolipin synthase-like enzyme